jgi:hypothetical protein
MGGGGGPVLKDRAYSSNRRIHSCETRAEEPCTCFGFLAQVAAMTAGLSCGRTTGRELMKNAECRDSRTKETFVLRNQIASFGVCLLVHCLQARAQGPVPTPSPARPHFSPVNSLGRQLDDSIGRAF